jgi:superfamily II DNA or RNA helicase
MDREWIKYIDTSLIDIFPIQFANCDRLQKNDALYIFDEVGSGKTISSGLMALDYLSNYPDKNVLVVTTNALCKKSIFSEYGQFLKDWYDKLPFIQLGLKDKIEIVNNHYSNLNPNGYGLVIVDEAQLFLNQDSLRYQKLSEIKADKIVFLTATPIKRSKDDLKIYVDLAENILGHQLSRNWIDEINTIKKEHRDIICSKFDETYPVTR